MRALLLTGGRVVDPANSRDEVADVLLLDGRVAKVGADAGRNLPEDAERFDCRNKVVCPGLIDLHVHFREPGQTAKETILTAAEAAARGGFTTVGCMPNTTPRIDNSGTVALIRDRGRHAKIRVEVAGAITKDIA